MKTFKADVARQELQAAVGRRIRDLREHYSLGQAETAEAAKLDKSTMFRIEKGEQNITLETLARIALALDVGMDALLAGVDPDPAILEERPRAKTAAPAASAATKPRPRRAVPAAA